MILTLFLASLVSGAPVRSGWLMQDHGARFTVEREVALSCTEVCAHHKRTCSAARLAAAAGLVPPPPAADTADEDTTNGTLVLRKTLSAPQAWSADKINDAVQRDHFNKRIRGNLAAIGELAGTQHRAGHQNFSYTKQFPSTGPGHEGVDSDVMRAQHGHACASPSQMGALSLSEIEQAWDVNAAATNEMPLNEDGNPGGEPGELGRGNDPPNPQPGDGRGKPRLGVRHAAQVTDRMHGIRVCTDPTDVLCTEWADFLPAVYLLRDNVRCHRMGADPPIAGPACVGWGASTRGADTLTIENSEDLFPWRRPGFEPTDQRLPSMYRYPPPPSRASWNRSSSTQMGSGYPMYLGEHYLGKEQPLEGDVNKYRDRDSLQRKEADAAPGMYHSTDPIAPTSTTMTAHDRMLEENSQLLVDGALGAAPSAEQLRRHAAHCDAVPPTSNDRQMAWSRLCCCYDKDALEDPNAVCPFIVCGPGNFSSGEHTCQSCPPNTFSDSPKGSIECVNSSGCAAGRFANSTLRACQDCPVNTFSTDGTMCRACPMGSIASEGSHGCNASNVGPGWVLAQPMDSCSTTCARWGNTEEAGEEWQADSVTCDESVLQSLDFDDIELIGRILHSIVVADGSSKGQRPALPRKGGPYSETQVSRAKLNDILKASDSLTSKPSMFSDEVPAPGTQIGHIPDLEHLDQILKDTGIGDEFMDPMFRESQPGSAHQLDPNANMAASPYAIVDGGSVTIVHSGRRRISHSNDADPNSVDTLNKAEGFVPYLGIRSKVIDPLDRSRGKVVYPGGDSQIDSRHIRAFFAQHFAKCDTVLTAMSTAPNSIEDEMERPHFNQTTWTSLAHAFLSDSEGDSDIRERLLHYAGLTGSKSKSRGGVARRAAFGGGGLEGLESSDIEGYSIIGDYKRFQGQCTAPQTYLDKREFFEEAVNDDDRYGQTNDDHLDTRKDPHFFLTYSTFQRPPRFTGSTVSRVGHRVCCCAVAGFAAIACPVEGASKCLKGEVLDVAGIPTDLSDCSACKGDFVARKAKEVACERCPPGRKSWTTPSTLDNVLDGNDPFFGLADLPDASALQSSCRFTQQERDLALSSALGFWALVVASLLPFILLFLVVCAVPCCSRTCKCNIIEEGNLRESSENLIPGVASCCLYFFCRSVGLRVRPCCTVRSAHTRVDDTDAGHDVGCIETALRAQQAAEARVLTYRDGQLLPLCGKSTDISDIHSGVGLFFHDLARIARVFLLHAATLTVALVLLATYANSQDVDEGCAETPSAWDQTITRSSPLVALFYRLPTSAVIVSDVFAMELDENQRSQQKPCSVRVYDSDNPDGYILDFLMYILANISAFGSFIFFLLQACRARTQWRNFQRHRSEPAQFTIELRVLNMLDGASTVISASDVAREFEQWGEVAQVTVHADYDPGFAFSTEKLDRLDAVSLPTRKEGGAAMAMRFSELLDAAHAARDKRRDDLELLCSALSGSGGSESLPTVDGKHASPAAAAPTTASQGSSAVFVSFAEAADAQNFFDSIARNSAHFAELSKIGSAQLYSSDNVLSLLGGRRFTSISPAPAPYDIVYKNLLGQQVFGRPEGASTWTSKLASWAKVVGRHALAMILIAATVILLTLSTASFVAFNQLKSDADTKKCGGGDDVFAADGVVLFRIAATVASAFADGVKYIFRQYVLMYVIDLIRPPTTTAIQLTSMSVVAAVELLHIGLVFAAAWLIASQKTHSMYCKGYGFEGGEAICLGFQQFTSVTRFFYYCFASQITSAIAIVLEEIIVPKKFIMRIISTCFCRKKRTPHELRSGWLQDPPAMWVLHTHLVTTVFVTLLAAVAYPLAMLAGLFKLLLLFAFMRISLLRVRPTPARIGPAIFVLSKVLVVVVSGIALIFNVCFSAVLLFSFHELTQAVKLEVGDVSYEGVNGHVGRDERYETGLKDADLDKDFRDFMLLRGMTKWTHIASLLWVLPLLSCFLITGMCFACSQRCARGSRREAHCCKTCWLLSVQRCVCGCGAVVVTVVMGLTGLFTVIESGLTNKNGGGVVTDSLSARPYPAATVVLNSFAITSASICAAILLVASVVAVATLCHACPSARHRELSGVASVDPIFASRVYLISLAYGATVAIGGAFAIIILGRFNFTPDLQSRRAYQPSYGNDGVSTIAPAGDLPVAARLYWDCYSESRPSDQTLVDLLPYEVQILPVIVLFAVAAILVSILACGALIGAMCAVRLHCEATTCAHCVPAAAKTRGGSPFTQKREESVLLEMVSLHGQADAPRDARSSHFSVAVPEGSVVGTLLDCTAPNGVTHRVATPEVETENHGAVVRANFAAIAPQLIEAGVVCASPTDAHVGKAVRTVLAARTRKRDSKAAATTPQSLQHDGQIASDAVVAQRVDTTLKAVVRELRRTGYAPRTQQKAWKCICCFCTPRCIFPDDISREEQALSDPHIALVKPKWRHIVDVTDDAVPFAPPPRHRALTYVWRAGIGTQCWLIGRNIDKDDEESGRAAQPIWSPVAQIIPGTFRKHGVAAETENPLKTAARSVAELEVRAAKTARLEAANLAATAEATASPACGAELSAAAEPAFL